jgi:hypothetical protein
MGQYDDASLWRDCVALFGKLHIPEHADPGELCQVLAAKRGRKLRLVATHMVRGACGVWISTQRRDYVFYEACTTPAHQRHIVLHEAGHLIFDHQGTPDLDGVKQFHHLDPIITTGTAAARLDFDDYEERQAEMFAYAAGPHFGLPKADANPIDLDPVVPVLAEAFERLARR